MKWKLSLPEPPMLLYYSARFMGLAAFTVKNDGFHPPNHLNKLYTGFLIAILIILMVPTTYFSLSSWVFHSVPRTIKMCVLLQHSTAALTTFILPMTFLWMYKKGLHIMNALRDIGNELKSLGIEEDHGKFFKNLWLTTVMTNALGITFYVILGVTEARWSILYLIIDGIGNLYRLNIILIFVQTMFFVKKRFTLVNEELYNIFNPTGHRRPLHHSQIFVVCRNPREETPPDIEELTDLQRFRKIESSHLKLCDLVHQATHLFAIPFISKCFQSCIELTAHSFWMYFIVRNFDQMYSATETTGIVMDFLRTLFRMAILTVQLFAIARASVETCEAGNAMKAVLYRVWYKFKPWDLKDEFYVFSLQLMQKPVAVSIFGFFDLSYSYIYKIFCVVIAYLIILIQFDVSQPYTGP